MYQMPGSNIIPYKGNLPKLASGVFVAAGAQLIGDLEIGADSSIWFNTVIRGDCNYIRIGSRTNVQDGSVIHVTNSTAPTLIGNDVTIGHGVVIHGCTIQDGSLIGMGAILLDHCVIGKNSFVAAGSLNPPGNIFPEGVLIKGSPAVVARPLTEQELSGLKQSVTYYLEYKSFYEPLKPRP